jgi:hypothetical protein
LFSPPFIKPTRLLTADDTFYRSMAQASANGNTSLDAQLLALDLTELDASISRREECSETLFKGKVTCRDGYTGEITTEIFPIR